MEWEKRGGGEGTGREEWLGRFGGIKSKLARFALSSVMESWPVFWLCRNNSRFPVELWCANIRSHGDVRSVIGAGPI